MPVIPHNHQWSSVNGGYVCTLQPCTAMYNQAALQANAVQPSTQGSKHFDLNQVLTESWKKNGGS